MVIISLMNLKGGVAKTISTANIGDILVRVHGKRVLLVDNDHQGNLSKLFNRHNYELGSIADVLLLKGGCAANYIQPTDYEGLDILPANMHLLQANVAVQMDQMLPQQTRYRDALAQVADAYDYCLIDNAPNISISTINALVAADEVLIPVKLDEFALDGLDVLQGQIAAIQEKLNPKVKIRGAFITDYHRCPETERGEMQLHTTTDLSIFPTKIRRSDKVEGSTYAHMPLYEYSRRSVATIAYTRLVRSYLAGEPLPPPF